MSDKDPPPFGYTFSPDFFSDTASLPTYDSHGQSLLNDSETQTLTDFFSTNPFDSLDTQPSLSALEAKASVHDYNNWPAFIAPPTVHRVTSTYPEQAHLQHGFHQEQHYTPSLHTNYLDNTPDDLQAASTLFNNSQPSYTDTRSHSFNGHPTSSTTTLTNGAPESSHNAFPMVVTPHGLLNEQLAALIPNHTEQGTLDAQLAAQWSTQQAQQQQQEFGLGLPPPKLTHKRSYTFGTDNTFNTPSAHSAPNQHQSEHTTARHSIHNIPHSRTLLQMVGGVQGSSTSPTQYTNTNHAPLIEPSNDEQSDAPSSDEQEDDRPAKKQKKSRYRVAKESPKKGARIGKNRKASLIEESAKKKRPSAAAQKLQREQKAQRENLTEEQKRSNHILSEQKRRNLIKQGFQDLHELVPAIRGGGLSKSAILAEAANFLEKLIQDNDSLRNTPG